MAELLHKKVDMNGTLLGIVNGSNSPVSLRDLELVYVKQMQTPEGGPRISIDRLAIRDAEVLGANFILIGDVLRAEVPGLRAAYYYAIVNFYRSKQPAQ